MALPNQIVNTVPGATDSISQGDDQIRALKLAIQDIFGIPNATLIANQVMSMVPAGLQSILFQDSGPPGQNGRLQKDLANLKFHDGTASRTLLTTAFSPTIFVGVLRGSYVGDYLMTNPALSPVDAANLSVNLNIPSGARWLIMNVTYAIREVVPVTGGAAVSVDSSVDGNLVLGSFLASGQLGGNQTMSLWIVKPNPTAGLHFIHFQARSLDTPGLLICNNANEGLPAPNIFYAVTY